MDTIRWEFGCVFRVQLGAHLVVSLGEILKLKKKNQATTHLCPPKGKQYIFLF
jgi:hypothetical protein